MTTALSHISGTFVISRATAYSYRGKAEDCIEALGGTSVCDMLSRGSVRRAGPTLHMNAELSSTETGAQLWSDSFDQTVADLALGQEQIVTRIGSALNIRLTDIEAARGLKEHPTNPDAFDLILRARAIMLLPETKDTTAQALALFQQALARDSNSVLALSGAIIAAFGEYFRNGRSYDFAMDLALGYLARAQVLDPNSEDVLVAQSWVLDFQTELLDFRHASAELEAVSQRLIDLYPNNSIGYFRLGDLRRTQQKYDEAANYFARSIQINPRNPGIRNLYWYMTLCRIVAGHDQEGLEWAERTIGAAGTLPSHREEMLLSIRGLRLTSGWATSRQPSGWLWS